MLQILINKKTKNPGYINYDLKTVTDLPEDIHYKASLLQDINSIEKLAFLTGIDDYELIEVSYSKRLDLR